MGFLDRRGIDFDLVTHRHTGSSSETARAAAIPASKLAKAVLMLDQDDYVLAVVPASRRVNPFALRELVDRDPLMFADESDMPFIFRDCERGAIPAIGAAFGLTTVIDDDLLHRHEVYFEAGDHEHLVHTSGPQFWKLMSDQAHGAISY
jgi:Ala-tRNA(Pro) deacylase